MKITDREITKAELDAIYSDFKKIEVRDGVAQCEPIRHQYTAQEDDEVIGFVSGLVYHKWLYLTDLWVEESHRREGLGTKLLRLLEEKAAGLGIEHIYTWTSGFINPRFYESRGYRAFAVFEGYYEVEGYNQIGYRKDFAWNK